MKLNDYQPIVLNPETQSDRSNIDELRAKGAIVFDTLYDQLTELVKLRNPQIKPSAEQYATLILSHLNNTLIDDYGVWIYYPWNHHLVHTLNEEEFIEVRTSRNQYKITKAESEVLASKKIGVIGLSVGQSIALTLAIERVCGELRLADFDTIELSNLNRIRTGIHNLGIPKVIIAAREIAEIDPYLKITLFPDGINEENIGAFFGEGENKLNILVEVCDSLDIKIKSRHKARSLKIPVIMDTNDRGMVDIERFDLEPERKILHGLIDEATIISSLTSEQQIQFLMKMVSFENVSERLKNSLEEMGKSIMAFPQLASSVTLGGSVTTHICRKISLNYPVPSGRFYIDFDNLIS